VLQRLAKVREALNLKQEDVAEIINFSRSAISKIESGKQEAGALELMTFYYRTHNVPPDYFFNEKEPSSKEEAKFSNIHQTGKRGTQQINTGTYSSGGDISVCLSKLDEMTRDRDKWKDKYIELLEKGKS